jgi:hypothetical protein
MNRLMVKPIPHKSDTPRSWSLPAPIGRSANSSNRQEGAPEHTDELADDETGRNAE